MVLHLDDDKIAVLVSRRRKLDSLCTPYIREIVLHQNSSTKSKDMPSRLFICSRANLLLLIPDEEGSV